MSYLSNKNVLIFCNLILLPFFVFFITKAVALGYSDFAAYYFGSQQLLNGNYLSVYDTASFNILIQSLGFQNTFVSYTPFPPFTSLLFAPFTIIPIGISKLFFNILSCLFFLYTLNRCFTRFSINPVFIVFVPILFYTPIRSNIYFGQSYIILFCLLMEGYMAYEKKRTLLSSILWGIAIVFKVFPVLIFFYLLLKKEYKAMIYLSGICFLLLLTSIAINGSGSWQLYITELLPRLNNGELNDSFTYIFQSAFMLLKNFFIYDEILNPTAVFPNFYLFCILLAIFKSLIIGACIMLTLKKDLNNFLIFSLWITASLLISPNGSTYSQILVLIPLLALFSLGITASQKIISAGLVLLICNVPVHYFSNLPLLLKFPRLYLLIAFFLLLIILSKVRFDFRILTGCLILFLFLESIRLYKKHDYSVYFSNDHKHLMVYDYVIKENNITRYYWSVEGGKQDTLNYKIASYSSDNLTIKENQIYFQGKKITETHDWKRKPTLVNNEYILYLSDKDRGIGFYTLRKINLPEKKATF